MYFWALSYKTKRLIFEPVPATTSTNDFGLIVDQLRDQYAYAQGFWTCMMAMCSAVARPYQATPESASATRQALGAEGLMEIPGPRSRRLSAAERSQLEVKTNAAKMYGPRPLLRCEVSR